MRIDAYNQISQIYKTNSKVKTQATAKVSGRDNFEISDIGKDIQVAKQAVNNSPDIREDKVASLKAQIESGNYEVDADSFASKLMEQFGI